MAEAPTTTTAFDLEQRVAALSPQQRAWLAQRLFSGDGASELPIYAASETTDSEPAISAARPIPPATQLVAYFVPASNTVPAATTLREHLRLQLPEYMVPVYYVPLSALPRTPNGKLDQRALPDPTGPGVAVTGTAVTAGSAPSENTTEDSSAVVLAASAAEAILASIWAEVLGFDTISVDDNFFEVGGDSILSIQIVARARQAGLRLAPDDLFQHQTVAELARVVETRRPSARRTLSDNTAPLTPIQHWFFELQLAEPQQWNQAVLLKSTIPLESHHLASALRILVQRHDALRLRFQQSSQGWQQEVGSPATRAEPLVGSYSLPAHDAAASTAALGAIAATVQSGFDLASGCLLRAAYIEDAIAGENLVLLAIHHLAIDAIGLGVLVEDLAHCYRQLAEGSVVVFPEPSATFQEWAHGLAAYAGQARMQSELGFWTQMLSMPSPLLPTDYARPADLAQINSEATSERVSVMATPEDTMALLHRRSPSGGTLVHDTLLTALALTVCEWCAHDTILVGLEGHGREGGALELDLSRSVGWFTSYYPLVLRLGADRTPAGALQAMRDQLQHVPQRGIGYGILRYLTTQGQEALAPLRTSELLFNYLGQFDRSRRGWDFLAAAEGDVGPLRSPRNRRHHLLECNAVVLNGVLQLHWEYSNRLHQRASIERLAVRYLAHLHSLVAQAASAPNIYTPADFPDANLTQAQLDELLNGLDL
jgi:non-ribosomal peptide synthase protein (TIGR01720 family)